MILCALDSLFSNENIERIVLACVAGVKGEGKGKRPHEGNERDAWRVSVWVGDGRSFLLSSQSSRAVVLILSLPSPFYGLPCRLESSRYACPWFMFANENWKNRSSGMHVLFAQTILFFCYENFCYENFCYEKSVACSCIQNLVHAFLI